MFRIKREKPLSEKEVEYFRQKYKGKIPLKQLVRVGQRYTFQIDKNIKEGRLVEYKNNFAYIKSRTDKGIYVNTFEKDKEGLPKLTGKTEFIPNKEIFEGKVYPVMMGYSI